MRWLLIALISGIGFGLSNTLTKLASDKIFFSLSTAFLTLSGSIVALAITGIIAYMTNVEIPINRKGIGICLLAGPLLFLGIGMQFLAFSYGAPLGIGMTIILIVTIATGIIAGILFLGESLSIKQMIGLGLSVISISLLVQG